MLAFTSAGVDSRSLMLVRKIAFSGGGVWQIARGDAFL